MLELTERLAEKRRAAATLTLPFEQRQKSRLRAVLSDGREVGIVLPRGTVLKGGDLLGDGQGLVVEIRAATELLSAARTDQPLLLARACYHLGNRHVALEIERTTLYYLHDHVLDEMLRGLGMEVFTSTRSFSPESGAYHGQHGH